MENNNHFYIYYLNQMNMTFKDDDIHLERIFSKNQAIEILEEYYNSFDVNNQPVIITNDTFLNKKYRNAYNSDEFKKYCGIKDFEEKNINLNFEKEIFDNKVFDFFEDLVNFKIISATQQWNDEGTFTDEYHQTHDLGIKYYGWETNLEFEYFQLPEDIQNYNIHNIKLSLSDIEKRLEINLKQLINDNSLIKIKEGNSFIWYWSSEKRIRIVAEVESIKFAKDNPEIKLQIQKNIVLVKNDNSLKFGDYFVSFYLVYTIDYPFNNIIVNNTNNLNQNQYSSNDWLENASGTNDPDTMNDVYWNLD